MTITSAPASSTTRTGDRLRAVLLEDAAVTAAVGVGVGVVVAAQPLADELPGTATAMRVLGALFVVVAVDVALMARTRGRRLATLATVVGELALGWAAVSIVVALAAGASGAALAAVLGVAVASACFGIAELRLARRLHAELGVRARTVSPRRRLTPNQ